MSSLKYGNTPVILLVINLVVKCIVATQCLLVHKYSKVSDHCLCKCLKIVSVEGSNIKLGSRRQKDVSAALGSHLNVCFIALALWCCPLANTSTLLWG